MMEPRRFSLAEVNSASEIFSLGQQLEFPADGGHDCLKVFGTYSGGDAQQPGIAEKLDIRLDGIGQPQLLPNYLEEAGTHVASQDQLEHGGRVAPGIPRRQSRAPQDQVDLLQVSGQGVDPGMGDDGLAPPAGGAVGKPFETGSHQVHHFLVPDLAGGGHYHVPGPVG